MALLLAAFAPSTAAADRTVILTSKHAPAAAWSHYAAVSDFDDVSVTHSLWFWDGTDTSLIGGEQRDPFDVDVGPDANGAPLVAFADCRAGDCDIRLVAPLAQGAMRLRETPKAARTVDRDEVLPAVSGNALAWVARGRGSDVLWLANGAQTARRVDWLRPGDRVRDLDLEGNALAAIVRSQDGSMRVIAGPPDAPVRYGRVRKGRAGYVGVSLEGRRLAFARTCTRRQCRGVRTGFYRTALGDRSFERAAAPKRVTAFAMGGEFVYWNELAADRGCPTGGCGISTARPRFSPADRP